MAVSPKISNEMGSGEESASRSAGDFADAEEIETVRSHSPPGRCDISSLAF